MKQIERTPGVGNKLPALFVCPSLAGGETLRTKRQETMETHGEPRVQEFLDMIAPSVIQFYTDHFIVSVK